MGVLVKGRAAVAAEDRERALRHHVKIGLPRHLWPP
eukprot:CAMPEP_0172627204 /NCGR_PEP_ID=MMETSP1068-20121228/155048_1 /TAXON_ID=35684 /ORGANISM="Pseudopedinella elastica, Strain CCMP716" /LENGTH=35 /DNA_ID= /DNA_START= /DNA_END= /DNA_ORIENTATION=